MATVVLLVVLVGGGVLVFNKLQSQSPPTPIEETASTTPVVNPETAPSTPAATTSADTSELMVNVEAGSYYFKPNMIKAKKGQNVKVVVKSVSMMHNFNIDDLGVKSTLIQNGETGMVEFTASKIGIFEYYCSVGQHKQLGQVGKLIVEE